MSLKKYFEIGADTQALSNKSAAEIADQVESVGYHEQDIIKEERYLPQIDLSKPANFARYGSAEEYYTQAIKRIYQTYPYDGSLQERLEWENESSYIDLHIFDTKYPRTNGYIIFSADGWGTPTTYPNGYGASSLPEYVAVKGGPSGNPLGATPTRTQFTGSNYYEPSKNRGSNLALNVNSEGASVEFWLKKDAFNVANTEKEVILDIWNGVTSSATNYARLRLELTGAARRDGLPLGAQPFLLTLYSGSTGFSEASIAPTSVTTTGSVADGNWHHYAVTLKQDTNVTTRFYMDGQFRRETQLSASGMGSLSDISGYDLRATLGALVTAPRKLTTPAYAGKLSASLDEFRFWKTQRTSQQIGRHWFTQVGGGVNTDPAPFIQTEVSANLDLGVYFKFNEGITGNSTTDSTVLDFSGRFSNGSWTGYTSNSRNTGSAIVLSNAAIKEFKDPIIYPKHPSVVSLLDGLQLSGSNYDVNNNAAIYHTMPSWVIDDDADGTGELKKLTQILGSYFDTLHMQISDLSRLKEISYVSGSDKPLPFAEHLLQSHGFVAPDLFIEADVIEKLADRSEKRIYEKSLHEIKNVIYKNIYNNLSYIYKSKGTEKSFRNLIRCFGVDDELIKFNMYANNVEFELRNDRRNIVVADRFVDFNTGANKAGVVCNAVDTTNTASVGFITSSAALLDGHAITLESEILFPLKSDQASVAYVNTDTISSSLFGIHGVGKRNPGTNPTWPSTDRVNFQVYAVRDEINSTSVRFVLTSSTNGKVPYLTSPLFEEVYDNSRWNLAVRIKPEKYPLSAFVEGADLDPLRTTGSYTIELHGVEADAGEIVNTFTAAKTVDSVPVTFMTSSRRVYVGAHRVNFTGSVLQTSDVKVNACRFWLDYLQDSALGAHALDTESYGALHPHYYAYPFKPSSSYGDVTKFDTLVFNWEFLTNTGSNAQGQFQVADLSSGSAYRNRINSSFDALSTILNRQYTASGSNFAVSSTTPIDKDFIVSSKLNLPENLYSHDMVTVLGALDQNVFGPNSRPTNYFFAFEKSMYQVISEEMVNYFGGLRDFHNLIGDPVNQWRPEYKDLNFMRQKFFEKVQNKELDFDKFYEFYKWLDASLSVMLRQLVPASADVAENVRTVIENHILERPKYQRKFPFLEKNGATDITGTLQGFMGGDSSAQGSPDEYPQGSAFFTNTAFTKRQIGSSNTSQIRPWALFHAPVPATVWGDPPEQKNIYWHRYMEERTPASNRATAFASVKKTFDRRTLSPAKFSIEGATAPGGVARHHNSVVNYVFRAAAAWGGSIAGSAALKNILVSSGSTVEQLIESPDVFYPPFKQRLGFDLSGSATAGSISGPRHAPFSLYSSSVVGGYNAEVVANYASGVLLTNLHNDFVIDTDIPMQGPFPEKYVGGRYYRHTALNKGTDSNKTRGEGFRINFDNGGTQNVVGVAPKSLAILPPNAPHGSEDTSLPTAFRFRDETTKRPVNIRNIRMRTGSTVIGNYEKNYQVVNSNSRMKNDPFFNDQSFNFALYPETLATRGRFPLYLPAADTETSTYNLKSTLYMKNDGLANNNTYIFDESAISATPAMLQAKAFTMGVWLSASKNTCQLAGPAWDAAGYSGDGEERVIVSWGGYDGGMNFTPRRLFLKSGSTRPTLCIEIMRGAGTNPENTYWESANDIFTGPGWYHILFGVCDLGSQVKTTDFFASNHNIYVNGTVRSASYYRQGSYVSTVMAAMSGSSDDQVGAIFMPWDGAWIYAESFHSASIAEISFWSTKHMSASYGPQKLISSDTFRDALYATTTRTGSTGTRTNCSFRNLPLDWTHQGAASLTGTLVTDAAIAAVSGGYQLAAWYRPPNVGQDHIPWKNDGNFGGTLRWAEATAPDSPKAVISVLRLSSSARAFANDATTNFNIRGGQTTASYGHGTANCGGNLDYLIPQRTGSDSNQTIIVNRYAGSGYEVMSLGYMNPAHEELSVYNAAPYHNLSIIDYGLSGSASVDPVAARTITVVDQINKNRGLDQRASLHCGPFGSDAAYGSVPELTYVTVPSWHKTNRNRKRRPTEATHANITASIYDNLFVQHAIPQSEGQYAWISSSMAAGRSILTLDSPASVTASALYQLVTASVAYGEGDFVGLRSQILDDVNVHGRTLGFADPTLPLDVMTFNGTNSRLDIGPANTWNDLIGGSGAAAKAFSVSMWIYPLSYGSADSRLCEFGDASDRRMAYLSTTRVNFKIVTALGNTTLNSGVGTVPFNRWTHAVFTYAGGSGGTMRIYLQGVQNTSTSVVTDPVIIATDTCVLGNNDDANRGFDGQMANAAIWGRELSANEVKMLYNNGGRVNMAGVTPLLDELLTWFRFSSDLGDTDTSIVNRSGETSTGIPDSGTGTNTTISQIALNDNTSPAYSSNYINSDHYWDAPTLTNTNDYLNALLLNRNGPYGYPTWKQIRAGDSPVARGLRQQNILGQVRPPHAIPDIINNKVIGFTSPTRPNTAALYYEPPINSRCGTVQFYLEDNTTPPPAPFASMTRFDNNITLRVPYGNNLEYFNSEGLNNRLGLKIDLDKPMVFDTVRDFVVESDLSTVVEYSETMYPSARNMYRNTVRGRTAYTIDNIWNDSRAKRSALGGRVGTMGQTITTSSIWPLDAHLNFTTTSSVRPTDGAGELMNSYSRFSASYDTNGCSSKLPAQIGTQVAAPTYAWRLPTGRTSISGYSFEVLAGDVRWQAAEQSGKNPYQNYSTWADQIRLVGKDHSIIPEFRISEHLQTYYTTHNGDFLTDKINNLYEITGASPASSAQRTFFRTYSNTDFMKYFAAIDEDLNDTRAGDLKITRDRIKLKASGLIKFLPYKGFYPAERTLELATLFSQSYGGSFLRGATDVDSGADAFRIALEPMMSPGILFNTIKSGIAVGSCVLLNTSSVNFRALPREGQSNTAFANGYPEGTLWYKWLLDMGTGSVDSNGYHIAKVPFDAIRDPSTFFNYNNLRKIGNTQATLGMGASSAGFNTYLRAAPRLFDTAVFDTAATLPGQSMDSGSSTFATIANIQFAEHYVTKRRREEIIVKLKDPEGGYRYAIDNFLCESSNFFLNGITSIRSNREDQFKSVKSGSVYRSTLRLFRSAANARDSSKWDMYSRASAFGFPLATYAQFGVSYKKQVYPTFSHVLPPYYSGEAIAELIYTASYDGVPTVDEVLANLRIRYQREVTYINQSASLAIPLPGLDSIIPADRTAGRLNDPRMQLDSSFNLTEKVSEVPRGTNTQQNYWLIQSKFETPILNFANASYDSPPASVCLEGTQTSAGSLVTRGMWHQYGSVITSSTAGVFAEITDDGGIINSLADVVGFQKGISFRVGDVKKENKLEEAIVVVPYKIKKNKRQFFKVNRRMRNTLMYRNLEAAVDKYVFPPKFDFTRHKTVNPVLTYVFEFSADITQQDIADMWQNLPPDVEELIDEQEVVVEDRELLNLMATEGDTIEWLVFKVKKKAQREYNKYRRSLVTDDTSAIVPELRGPYTYNWPYDYFSIVELAKIDATAQWTSADMQFEISENDEGDLDGRPPPTIAAAIPSNPNASNRRGPPEVQEGSEGLRRSTRPTDDERPRRRRRPSRRRRRGGPAPLDPPEGSSR